MPTEHISSSHSDQLNSYNVAQLQFTLAKSDDIHYLNLPAHDAALDYTARRMSSSATSNADTENSSVLSRPEKRSLTPDDDQHAKKLRSDDHPSWEHDKLNADPGLDQSKVQLPSISTTLDDNYRYSNANDNARRSSLPVLHSESRVRHAPYPSPSMRHNNYAPSNGSSLSTYTFPPDEHPQDRINARPKVSTDVGFAVSNSYDSSYPSSGLSSDTTTPSTAFSSSSLASDLRTPGISPYSESDNWNPSPSGIVRPSSTPGQLSSPAVKYDDGLRHASFSAPMSQAQMFAGSARISGQHDRRSLSGIKGDWPFPNSEFALPSNGSQYSPSLTAPNLSVASPSRSPSAMPASTLVDRPPRKRGKLPKETTDYLKAWLHRHSDHPYPSEEEKKHLCHATGLSMSQVSNWMINARRRILAPAHRAASGPTTTAPFPPSARSTSLSGLLGPIATSRRSSMPSADALQLYHPMTLQSMPNSTHHSSEYGSRHGMLNMPSSRSNHLGGSGLDYHQSRHVGLYAPGQGTHGSHNQSSQYTDVPLSAPPSLSNNPFSSHNSHSSGQNMYPSLLPSPRSSAQQPYYAEGHSHSGSGSGSTYGTPQ